MTDQAHFIEFSKPFILAAKKVFETMVFTKLEPQKPEIKADKLAPGDITAILGLNGEVVKNGVKVIYKAMLVMSFPYDTYFKIAGAMLGETYTSYVPDIHDVGGEVTNMVMGNAKAELQKMGYTTSMAIPSSVEGKNVTVSYPVGTTVVLIPMKSDHGQFYIELCYKEGE